MKMHFPNSLLLLFLFSVASYAQEADKEQDPLSPNEALTSFTVPDEFQLDLSLSEPDISQPVFFNFDERGRMWVMNYLQYPNPAGLRMVSRDKFWRAVYDKVPVAPPNHARGADKITIHEDTDGDGEFDSHKTFVDGLSIATSFVRGRGGVWVLNPPYLLFYPDANNDDVPDGDPVVHLEGFGIEDTHSCANSLRWGPDGWLYAGQGSTVTGNIKRPSDGDSEEEVKPIHSLGQLIWRYNPEAKIYEIFAEGGGNTFGVEFDARGNVYSGHNGGNTRGFHFVQGGYYRKGFGKHGPLSNPFAFGYFEQMTNNQVERFVHNFVIYESGEFPESYRGQLYGVEPMQGQIVRSKFEATGTSFETADIDRIVKTDDVWFRPVDIKTGPDGAIYFADFYEPQISHREHFAGQIDKERGRIFRLSAKTATSTSLSDFSKATTSELIELLNRPNKWHRQTALRILYDRKDNTAIAGLVGQLDSHARPLEILWAINACGGMDAAVIGKGLSHDSNDVRAWTIRLITDDVSGVQNLRLESSLAQLASKERAANVRSQMLSSVQRMPVEAALQVLAPLLLSSDDAKDAEDIHIPMLTWWAIEKQCQTSPQKVIAFLRDNPWVWETALFESTVTERLMRRFALSGTRQDYGYCTQLFEMAPNESTSKAFMRGFELAFKGRSMIGLPAELNNQLAAAGGDSLTFRLRQGDSEAVEESVKIVSGADGQHDKALRISLIETFGDIAVGQEGASLAAAIQDKDEDVVIAALNSSRRYDVEALGQVAVDSYSKFTPEAREVAESMLASRKSWSLLFLQAVEAGSIQADQVPKTIVQRIAMHGGDKIDALVSKHWADIQGSSSEKLRSEIQRISKVIAPSEETSADPMSGKKLFNERCGKCHLMFGEGGSIGPDLTTYNRKDDANILINIVNPSAEIREGFENYKILTFDGLVVVGFIADQDNKVVVVRGSDGQTVTIERDDIDEMSAQKTSLMPEGLLDGLRDQQLKDLFAFIRSSQPLN